MPSSEFQQPACAGPAASNTAAALDQYEQIVTNLAYPTTHRYEAEEIRLCGANMDRLNGWAELLQGFGEPESNAGGAAGVKPTLSIHQRCQRLVETLPTLQHDPNRPEDVLKVDADDDGVGGDDAADCLRYLVATKTRTITQRKLRGF